MPQGIIQPRTWFVELSWPCLLRPPLRRTAPNLNSRLLSHRLIPKSNPSSSPFLQEKGINCTHHATSWTRSPPERPSCHCRSGASKALSWAAMGGIQRKTNVSFNRTEFQQANFFEHRTGGWGHWRPSEHFLMDTRGAHRAFSDGHYQREGGAPNATGVHVSHWRPSEHSLMDTRGGSSSILWPHRGKVEHKTQNGMCCAATQIVLTRVRRSQSGYGRIEGPWSNIQNSTLVHCTVDKWQRDKTWTRRKRKLGIEKRGTKLKATQETFLVFQVCIGCIEFQFFYWELNTYPIQTWHVLGT